MNATPIPVLLVLAGAACSGGGSPAASTPATAATAPADASTTAEAAGPSPVDTTVAALQKKMEELCLCRDADCVDAVDTKYAATVTPAARAEAAADAAARERIAAIEGEEAPCRERALAAAEEPLAPAGDSEVTARFERARDQMCACANNACLERIEKKLGRMVGELSDDELLAIERPQYDLILALGQEARRCGDKIRAGN